MNTPPLDVLALFADDVPAQSALTSAQRPIFAVQRRRGPFFELSAALDDPNQPLTPDERLAATIARGALHLRCQNDQHPTERLLASVDRIGLLYLLGATAIVFPAAHKVVGRSALAIILDDHQHRWLSLFIHHHAIHEAGSLWLHTHGMEHFGLPDLEVRAPHTQGEAASGLLTFGLRHLLDHGMIASDAPFLAAPAPPSAEHRYGSWGARQIRTLGSEP